MHVFRRIPQTPFRQSLTATNLSWVQRFFLGNQTLRTPNIQSTSRQSVWRLRENPEIHNLVDIFRAIDSNLSLAPMIFDDTHTDELMRSFTLLSLDELQNS